MTKQERSQWVSYVKGVAADFGVNFQMAWELFCMLGPNEAYDGFITMLEDYAEEMMDY